MVIQESLFLIEFSRLATKMSGVGVISAKKISVCLAETYFSENTGSTRKTKDNKNGQLPPRQIKYFLRLKNTCFCLRVLPFPNANGHNLQKTRYSARKTSCASRPPLLDPVAICNKGKANKEGPTWLKSGNGSIVRPWSSNSKKKKLVCTKPWNSNSSKTEAASKEEKCAHVHSRTRWSYPSGPNQLNREPH